MTHIDRRKILTVVAVVPAVAALGAPAFASDEPGELAALVVRYFAEVEDFNRLSPAEGRTDEDNDALAEATFDNTMQEMVGVPARSRQDALAALDWLTKEGVDLDELSYGDWSPHARTANSLVDAIRVYIEGGVA